MADRAEQIRSSQEPEHNETASPDLTMAHVVQPRHDSLTPYGEAHKTGAQQGGGGPKVTAGPARR